VYNQKLMQFLLFVPIVLAFSWPAHASEKAVVAPASYPVTFSNVVSSVKVMLLYYQLGEGSEAATQAAKVITSPLIDAVYLLEDHPDWTVEDYLLELDNRYERINVSWENTSKEDKLALVKEIITNSLDEDDLANMLTVAGNAYQSCLRTIDSMPPTKRPFDPIDSCEESVNKGEYFDLESN
jgi:hypothetical protein